MARLRASFVLFAVLALIAAFVPGSTAARDDPKQRWIGIWGASPLRPDPINTTDQAVLSRTGFENQTLRQIVYPHFYGTTVRVRLANTWSDQPLDIGAAHIALQSEQASLVSGTDRPLT